MTSTNSRWVQGSFLAALLLTFVILLPTKPPVFLRVPPTLPSKIIAPRGCQDLSQSKLQPRENAAIVLLLRENDLSELIPTLRNFEEKFNKNFRYPYVVFSSPDEPDFSNDFKSTVAATLPPDAITEYSRIAEKDWSIPKSMDREAVLTGFEKQGQTGVQYGFREGYHHMCRWYSGVFATEKALEKYDWYWRLEPGVRFYCNISYDPFRFMAIANKVYGFVITIVETPNTIPTLFETLQEYREEAGLTPGPALWDFLTRKNNQKEEYNLCHFWTNFEIGDLRFFRSSPYQDLFAKLDATGKFYTERWGDAPIRSLALGLLTDIDQVHYFEDIAYKHDYFVHCPDEGIGCQCQCPRVNSILAGPDIDIDRSDAYSCLPKWRKAVESFH